VQNPQPEGWNGLLDSIKNPNITLRSTKQLPSKIEVTSENSQDIFSSLAQALIARRGYIKDEDEGKQDKEDEW